MLIFDSHVHLGLEDFVMPIMPSDGNMPIFHNALDNKYVSFARTAERNSIYKALSFAFPFPNIAVRAANQYVLDAAAKRPDLFLPLLLISDDLSYFCANLNNIAGAKEEFYLPGGRDLNSFMPIYEFLEANDLVLLIHPHRDDRINRILSIRSNFPNLKIILAHSGRKWPFTGDDILDTILPSLASTDLLFFDTSTIRDGKILRAIVNSIGVERVLFGSDYPFFSVKGENTYQEELATIHSARLTSHEEEMILSGNFRRIFLGDIWLRRVSRDDINALTSLLEDIPSEEVKFLAIMKKHAAFRSNIRSERHIFILENSSGIIGFVRESGRPNNTAMIEEVLIHPSWRTRGLGVLLLDSMKSMFSGLLAKTFSSNKPMNNLLRKCGFSVVNGNSILHWRWEHDS